MINVRHWDLAVRINFQARVTDEVRRWWEDFCKDEGYIYKGNRPYFSKLLSDIANGEWVLVRAERSND